MVKAIYTITNIQVNKVTYFLELHIHTVQKQNKRNTFFNLTVFFYLRD